MAAIAPRYSSLPADVMQIICEQLGIRQDFGTLFNCALAGRDNSLSKLAVENMYRVHSKSSVVAGDDTDLTSHGTSLEARSKEQRNNIAMWALQWRSIIRSSLRTTFYPYCLYIRSLDLSNLEELLSENIFRDSLFETFFAGDMAHLSKSQETPLKKKTRGSKKQIYQRIDVPQVLDLVGEAITSFLNDTATQRQADVALENLAGPINTLSLQKWTSQLPRLKSLTLFNGAALNKEVASCINEMCPDFDDLTFFGCDPGPKSSTVIDHDLASFFSGLRANSLKSFNAISARHVGPDTLLALNNHCKTLTMLKLDGLEDLSIKALSFLQGCKALETLEITDGQGIVDLEATENDVFLEVVAWLGACHQLKALSFKKLLSAPAILERVCLNNDIRLLDLDVTGYTLAQNQSFHRALSHQTSLQYLKLKADAEESFRDDIDILVSSIVSLKSLKVLNLVETSNYFRTPEIIHLTSSLSCLEEFWIGGYEINDFIWPHVSKLTNLKSLNIHALSSFTADGVLNYISTLGDSNHGLLLSVMNQTLEHGLSDKDLARIKRDIADKVDGQFDYVLFRDYESTNESFSD